MSLQVCSPACASAPASLHLYLVPRSPFPHSPFPFVELCTSPIAASPIAASPNRQLANPPACPSPSFSWSASTTMNTMRLPATALRLHSMLCCTVPYRTVPCRTALHCTRTVNHRDGSWTMKGFPPTDLVTAHLDDLDGRNMDGDDCLTSACPYLYRTVPVCCVL